MAEITLVIGLHWARISAEAVRSQDRKIGGN